MQGTAGAAASSGMAAAASGGVASVIRGASKAYGALPGLIKGAYGALRGPRRIQK